MKVNRLETHDRYEHFTKQNFDISTCCQSLIDKRPFGDTPFYIFAHARSLGLDEKFKLFLSGRYKSMEEVPDKTIIWQPRLTKPVAQENSMLFKGYPGTDNVKVIWIIPQRELWGQYARGKITENNVVSESVYNFQHNKDLLERPEEDDLSEAEIDAVYRNISLSAKGTPFKLET